MYFGRLSTQCYTLTFPERKPLLTEGIGIGVIKAKDIFEPCISCGVTFGGRSSWIKFDNKNETPRVEDGLVHRVQLSLHDKVGDRIIGFLEKCTATPNYALLRLNTQVCGVQPRPETSDGTWVPMEHNGLTLGYHGPVCPAYDGLVVIGDREYVKATNAAGDVYCIYFENKELHIESERAFDEIIERFVPIKPIRERLDQK